jgi:hypothetical protein
MTSDAGLRIAGAVVVYRLYDVGYEIDLERALDLLASTPGERATLRRTLQYRPDGAEDLEEKDRAEARRSARAEVQAIQIKTPPITSALGADTITLGDRSHDVHVSARIFDFGVVSLRLHIEAAPSPPPGVLGWREYTAFGNAVDAAPGLQALFARYIHQLTTRLASTISRPHIAPVTEDYIVYRITRLVAPTGETLPTVTLHDLDVVPLLLNEQRPLADTVRAELLPYWFSYYPDDLAILTWSSALIVDPTEGDSDVQLMLEFANAQLLELRYYDALLDAELPRMYDRIADRRARALFGRRYAALLTGLQTLVADSTEIVERAENALKVTDDVYLARVYAAALELFRGRVWRRGIDHKLAIIRQTYAMLNAEAMAVRNEVLEIAIIVLIVVEIIIAVVLGRR